MTTTVPRATESRSSDLLSLRNVGPAVVRHFARINIATRSDLVGRDPVDLFEQLNDRDRRPNDPCLLDTFMSAVDQAEGHPARPWWSYTAERRRIYPRPHRSDGATA